MKILLMCAVILALSSVKAHALSRADELRQAYNLSGHSEGGSFAEVYTSSSETDGRPSAGSIYFLLGAGEISHFHEIDCEEIWYYHEGCGLKITVLADGKMTQYLLGADIRKGQRHMAVIPKGAIFAAENLNDDGFTFVSCATSPKFRYEGFRLVGKKEIRERFPDVADDIDYLAY